MMMLIDETANDKRASHVISIRDESNELVKHSQKTQWEKFTLRLGVSSALITPFLFANAIRRFLEIQPRLIQEVNDTPYYKCTLHPEVIKAISYDGATVSTEALGITTMVVGFTMVSTILIAGYQFVYRHKNDEATLAEKMGQRIKELSYYRMPIVAISAIPGAVVMVLTAKNLGRTIDCPVTTLLTDSCEPSKQYDMLSLSIYPWMCITGSLLAFHSAGLAALTLTLPFKKSRAKFYNTLHKPFEDWYLNDDKWAVKILTWDMLAIPAMPSIAIYSSYSAITLVDHYAKNIGCSSIWNVLHLIFAEKHGEHTCSSAQMGLIVNGFIGDLEIGKIYLLYAVTKLVSYAFGEVIERIWDVTPDKLERVKNAIKAFTVIHQKSLTVGSVAGLIAAMSIIYFAKTLADNLLGEGLEVVYPYSSLPDWNTSSPIDNSTMTHLLETLCPYDKLDLNNMTILYDLTNDSVVFPVALACPAYGILSVGPRSILGLDIDCSPIVVTRSIAAFIGLFWAGVSGTAGIFYLLSSAVLLGSKALSRHVPVIGGDLQEPLLPDANMSAKPKRYGCLDRVYGFFKSAPRMDASLNQSTHFVDHRKHQTERRPSSPGAIS